MGKKFLGLPRTTDFLYGYGDAVGNRRKMERGARKLFKDGRSEGKKFDDAQ